MPKPSVSVEPAGSRPPESEIYRWEVSGKPVAVEIRLEVVDRLDREVVQTFRAITSRGSEVGGILLGRLRPQPRATVVIEDYEPVACDYRRGPLYLLAEADRARLEEALARWKNQPARDLSVVGFYRSNTRKELVLDEEDLALINQYFPDPHHVFLLVKPFASKPNLGGFFLREGSELPRESSLTFPFNRAELVKSGAVVAAAAPAAPAPAPAAAASPPSAPAAAPSSGPTPGTGARVPIEIRIAVAGEQPTSIIQTPPKEPEPPKADVRPAAVSATPPSGTKPAPAQRAPGAGALDGKGALSPTPAVKPEVKAPVGDAKVSADARPATAATTEAKMASAQPAVEAKPSEAGKAPAGAQAGAEIQPAPGRSVVEAKPAPEQKKASSAAPAAPTFAGVVVAEPAAPETGVESRAPSKRRLWIVAAALLLAAVAGVVLWVRSGASPASTTPEASALGLRVERSGGQLLLSWNRALPLLQTAQRAILSISDGDHREDVEMDLGQLRGGSIVYSPITSDVSFRLEITDIKNGKSVSESVRVLGGKPSPSGPPAEAGAPTDTPKGSGHAASASEGSKPAQETRAMIPPPSPARGESLAARLSPVEPLPAAEPPKAEPPVVNVPKPEAAPPPVEQPKPEPQSAPSGPTQPAPQVIQPATQAAKPAAEAPAPATRAATPAAEVSQPATAPPAAKPSEQPVRVGGAVQQAKLIRSRDPVYPPLARQARLQGVVRLEAVIGPDGRVEKVEAISGPPLLRQAAIDAVKQWVYQPSTLNGQPVRVTTQIEVNFTLGGR